MKSRLILAISLFLPGLLLVLGGIYYLAQMIQPLMIWNTSTGMVIALIDGGTDEETYFVRYKYEDETGHKFEATTPNAVGAEDLEVNEEITIYYKPEDPSNSIPAFLMLSYFLISLFIPFGMLLMWLGSPFNRKER